MPADHSARNKEKNNMKVNKSFEKVYRAGGSDIGLDAEVLRAVRQARRAWVKPAYLSQQLGVGLDVVEAACLRLRKARHLAYRKNRGVQLTDAGNTTLGAALRVRAMQDAVRLGLPTSGRVLAWGRLEITLSSQNLGVILGALDVYLTEMERMLDRQTGENREILLECITEGNALCCVLSAHHLKSVENVKLGAHDVALDALADKVGAWFLTAGSKASN